MNSSTHEMVYSASKEALSLVMVAVHDSEVFNLIMERWYVEFAPREEEHKVG